MFRNVTGAQEAVVHRQSEESLFPENHPIKLIKDIQSDDIAQNYLQLKTHWFHEREQLIENLHHLQKHQAFSQEIQHVQSLIECLNDLINTGEVTKNCQLLIDDMKKNISPKPETYLLTKKPLGEKMIRLPRHISKTTINISHPFQDEKIHHQIKTNEQDDTTVSSVSTAQRTSGIQFYVVAEQFRDQMDKKSSKKHYLPSSIRQ